MLKAHYRQLAQDVPVAVVYDRRTGDLIVTVDPSCPDGPFRFETVNMLLEQVEEQMNGPLLRAVV